MAGTLPDIKATIQFIDEDIINVKWTWALDSQGNIPSGKRKPIEVPDDILNTTVKRTSFSKLLKDYITVDTAPFQVDFVQ